MLSQVLKKVSWENSSEQANENKKLAFWLNAECTIIF